MTGALPAADRPDMPGYGVLAADAGGGLLPWTWAQARLAGSHDYWCATVGPAARPHVMPVWAVWLEGGLWFSSGGRSRKARNLAADPRCTLTTDDARNPVVVEGLAQRVVDGARAAAFLAAVNAKYHTAYDVDFLDPGVNATFRLGPVTVFGLRTEDFTGSPTRWRFDRG